MPEVKLLYKRDELQFNCNSRKTTQTQSCYWHPEAASCGLTEWRTTSKSAWQTENRKRKKK